MADSLCCTVETNAILQSNQTPIEIKKKTKTKNKFESVLVKWMNLEPVIQNEVREKEKNK